MSCIQSSCVTLIPCTINFLVKKSSGFLYHLCTFLTCNAVYTIIRANHHLLVILIIKAPNPETYTVLVFEHIFYNKVFDAH